MLRTRVIQPLIMPRELSGLAPGRFFPAHSRNLSSPLSLENSGQEALRVCSKHSWNLPNVFSKPSCPSKQQENKGGQIGTAGLCVSRGQGVEPRFCLGEELPRRQEAGSHGFLLTMPLRTQHGSSRGSAENLAQ